MSGRPGSPTKLKGLVSQRNICFATRPTGDRASDGRPRGSKYVRTGLALYSVPTNRLVTQLSRSADTFAGAVRTMRKFPGQPACPTRLSGRPESLTNRSGQPANYLYCHAATTGRKTSSNGTRTLFRQTFWSSSFPDQPTRLRKRFRGCEIFLVSQRFGSDCLVDQGLW